MGVTGAGIHAVVPARMSSMQRPGCDPMEAADSAEMASGSKLLHDALVAPLLDNAGTHLSKRRASPP